MAKYDNIVSNRKENGISKFKALKEIVYMLVDDLDLNLSLGYKIISKYNNGIPLLYDLKSIAGAFVYIFAKENNTPRTLNEIANELNIDIKSLGKVYKVICRRYGFKVMPPDPKNYINRYISKLNLSDISEEVKNNMESIDRNHFCGYKPSAVAISFVYATALLEDIYITQRRIRKNLNITTTTLRKISGLIASYLGKEDEYLQKIKNIQNKRKYEKNSIGQDKKQGD